MPDFLADPPSWLYLLAWVGVAVTAAAVWQARNRGTAIALAVATGILVTLYSLDIGWMSDREQAVQVVQKMAACIPAKQPQRLGEYISERFQMAGGSKATLIALAQRAIRELDLESVEVWDFSKEFIRPSPSQVQIEFRFKPKSRVSRGEFFRAKVAFTRESDGFLRMSEAQIFNPVLDKEESIPLGY